MLELPVQNEFCPHDPLIRAVGLLGEAIERKPFREEQQI